MQLNDTFITHVIKTIMLQFICEIHVDGEETESKKKHFQHISELHFTTYQNYLQTVKQIPASYDLI